MPNVSMRLLLDDVRSFTGENDIPLSPITVLVGENSSGKTTFLAMLAAVLNPQFPQARTLFNTAPFDLGSFDTIATYKGGRYGRAESFSIGLTGTETSKERTVKATYKQRVGQTQLAGFLVKEGSERIECTIEGTKIRGSATMTLAGGARETFNIDSELDSSGEIWIAFARALVPPPAARKGEPIDPKFREATSRVFDLLYAHRRGLPVIAIAPVRTKPHRTYDEVNDNFKPEGDHIPYLLSRLRNDPNPKSSRVWDALDRFGVDAGLYKKLSVKKLGIRPSDPFQVRVKISGPSVNLPDVGYGISQSLPIVVESVLAAKQSVLLVQQPEVHLHPRAQAALGSFFVRLAKEDKKQFIIETHSDYLLDRIRIDVAGGLIAHSDVSVLFFDRPHLQTRVHVLGLDVQGNFENAPPSFRSFFLNEELRLLTRGT